MLFGLWHISPALEMHDSHNATQGGSWITVVGTVFFTGLSGVGFALLRLFTGSLFPPAALHWAANGTGVVVGWVVHNVTRRIVPRSSSTTPSAAAVPARPAQELRLGSPRPRTAASATVRRPRRGAPRARPRPRGQPA